MVQEALDKSKRQTEELRKRARNAKKPSVRIQSEGLEIHYSPDGDYLTCTIGEPRPSVSIPAGSAHVLVDPDSGEVNALEVPFFLEVFEAGQLEGPLWDLAFRLIKSGHLTVYIPPRQEQERAEETFKDLVPA